MKEEAQVGSTVRWVDSGGEAGGKGGRRGWEAAGHQDRCRVVTAVVGTVRSSECARSAMLCSGLGVSSQGRPELDGDPDTQQADALGAEREDGLARGKHGIT